MRVIHFVTYVCHIQFRAFNILRPHRPEGAAKEDRVQNAADNLAHMT